MAWSWAAGHAHRAGVRFVDGRGAAGERGGHGAAPALQGSGVVADGAARRNPKTPPHASVCQVVAGAGLPGCPASAAWQSLSACSCRSTASRSISYRSASKLALAYACFCASMGGAGGWEAAHDAQAPPSLQPRSPGHACHPQAPALAPPLLPYHSPPPHQPHPLSLLPPPHNPPLPQRRTSQPLIMR